MIRPDCRVVGCSRLRRSRLRLCALHETAWRESGWAVREDVGTRWRVFVFHAATHDEELLAPARRA